MYQHIKQSVVKACKNINYVDSDLVLSKVESNFYSGITYDEMCDCTIMTAQTLIEEEPNYTYVASQVLLDKIIYNCLDFYGLCKETTSISNKDNIYKTIFPMYITKSVELGLLSPALLRFDLDYLANKLDYTKDKQFTYLGLQTLYDRYFIHSNEIRIELPQMFFMRVAMGLSFKEPHCIEDVACKFYNLLSSFDYMSSTPTLFNSGTLKPQLSSCYISTVSDDLEGIFNCVSDNARLSKWSGGIGNDWTPIRGLNSHIKGTNGKSQGVIPFLKVVNDTAVAVNQGGKRKGATCSYLETWHLDIEEFLELRKNTGDDRRRTHDMNTANWVPDLFMKRVIDKQEWTLFSPNDVSDLHELYGYEFENRYQYYEHLTTTGEITLFKKVSAQSLWRKMLTMLFETGHPWITFKDACNIRNPQQHDGVVHSSNLCTEITLNTKANKEIAVCNLGSVNLANHIIDGKLDFKKLEKTVTLAVHMLDNVIDINFYPVKEAKLSNIKHRPIGLGIMGFQDALYKLGISYNSKQAVSFADLSMEAISYYAINTSITLSLLRGCYSTFEGSLWSKGILPIDSLNMLSNYRRQKYLSVNNKSYFDWDSLRKSLKTHGIRNSNITAIAPTATISNITGVTQSIEPTYQNIYVKSNLSGEFTIINSYLVHDLKNLGLWDNNMINELKHYDGSIQKIDRIPDNIKKLYLNVFELDPKWSIKCASVRQKWIDQAQSLNIYLANPDGKKLDEIYKMAWLYGLKTTYYLRALSATTPEKSTVDTSSLNTVSNNFISLTDELVCESCQ